MCVHSKNIFVLAAIALFFSCDGPATRSVPKENISANDAKPTLKGEPAQTTYANGKGNGGSYSYNWTASSKKSKEVDISNVPTANYAVAIGAASASIVAATDATSDQSDSKPGQPDGNGFVSSMAAIEAGKDTSHIFIRTVDMKFRVKNVYSSTISIEDIVRHFGGFVTSSNLTSTVDNTTVTAISADSSLESIYYTVGNAITFRVPNTKLDSTLRAIAVYIDYLDYRCINAQDIAPQILADRLLQIRLSRHNHRLIEDIDHTKGKLSEETDAEQSLLDKDEQADNAKLHTLSLIDQVRFSTVNLDIYQRQSIKRQVIANDKNIHAYTPSIGSQLRSALLEGYRGLMEFILALAMMWPSVLAVIAGFVIYKRWSRKKE